MNRINDNNGDAILLTATTIMFDDDDYDNNK